MRIPDTLIADAEALGLKKDVCRWKEGQCGQRREIKDNGGLQGPEETEGFPKPPPQLILSAERV